MFAGHLGAAMIVGSAARRVNVGLLFVAALWLDIALWVFVLAGWEAVHIAPDFMATHQPRFDFAWSHGLLAGALWSAAATLLSYRLLARGATGRVATALWIGAAVFSHWLLDALVHVPELPLVGSASAHVGLGLWRHMPLALGVESLLVLLGLWLFLRGCGLSRPRRWTLATLALLALVFTILGMTVAPAPPSAQAMAFSSLLVITLLCAAAWWSGRTAQRRMPRSPRA